MTFENIVDIITAKSKQGGHPFDAINCMNAPFLVNKKLTEEQIKKIEAFGSEEEPILFAIIGDISADAKYSTCAIMFTATHFLTYDFDNDVLSERVPFDNIEEIFNKRMYGNGVMRLRTKDGEKRDVFRFTFSVATLCDAAATYAISVRDGEDFHEAFATIEAVYEKMLSCCPKCGRTLSAPGAPCVQCMKKLGIWIVL